MTVCPTCAAPLTADRPDRARLLRGLKGEVQRRVAGWLAEIYPDGATISDLIDAAYSDHPEGGPDWAEKCIHVVVWKLRKLLFRTGWTISPASNGVYKLMPLFTAPSADRRRS